MMDNEGMEKMEVMEDMKDKEGLGEHLKEMEKDKMD